MDALFSSPRWTLESDKQLFAALGEFSQTLVQRGDAVLAKLSKLERQCAASERNVLDATNQIQSLRNSQFIHTRVVEVPKTETARPAVGGGDAVPPAFQTSNSFVSTAVLLHGDEVDPLNERPLPYVIGSDEFYNDPNIGLVVPDDFIEIRQGDGMEEEVQRPPVGFQKSKAAAEDILQAQLVFGDTSMTKPDSPHQTMAFPSVAEASGFNPTGFVPELPVVGTTSPFADQEPSAITIQTRNSMEEGFDEDIFSAPTTVPVNVPALPAAVPNHSAPPRAITETIIDVSRPLPPPPPPPPRMTQNLLFDDVDDLFGDSVAPFSDILPVRPQAAATSAPLAGHPNDKFAKATQGSHNSAAPASSTADSLAHMMGTSMTIGATAPASRGVPEPKPTSQAAAKKKKGLFDDDDDDDDDDGLIY